MKRILNCCRRSSRPRTTPRLVYDRDGKIDVEPDHGRQSDDSRSSSAAAPAGAAFAREADGSAEDLIAGILVGAIVGLGLWLLIFFVVL